MRKLLFIIIFCVNAICRAQDTENNSLMKTQCGIIPMPRMAWIFDSDSTTYFTLDNSCVLVDNENEPSE